MHELAVCQALLDQVGEIARAHRATGVQRIAVRVGPLSGVEPALLAQAFSVARAGTVASAAALDIEEAALRVHCERCGAETAALVNRLVCGACGDYHTRVVSGDELLLARVELAVPSPLAPLPPLRVGEGSFAVRLADSHSHKGHQEALDV